MGIGYDGQKGEVGDKGKKGESCTITAEEGVGPGTTVSIKGPKGEKGTKGE